MIMKLIFCLKCTCWILFSLR